METTSAFNEDIIVRFLQSTATDQELFLLEEWLKAENKNQKIFKNYCDLWFAAETLNPGFSSDMSDHIQNFTSKLKHKDDNLPLKNFRNRFNSFLKAAALVAFGAGISWMAFYFIQDAEKEILSYNEIITPLGSRTHVLLPDGSGVWLNANSSLRYPENFAGEYREVNLKGEGFFEVVKDEGRQFIVSTSDIRIKVLGTTFNVKSYPEEGTIETTLIEGEVVLQRMKSGAMGKEITMKPEQRVTYIKDEGKVVLSEIKKMNASIGRPVVVPGNIFIADSVETMVYTSWKDGRLIIKSEPLEELSVKLARRFDVKIVFKDEKLKNFKFTGILENETLEQVLYALQVSSPLKYTIDRKTVYLESTN